MMESNYEYENGSLADQLCLQMRAIHDILCRLRKKRLARNVMESIKLNSVPMQDG
jgi:hypothetical protein